MCYLDSCSGERDMRQIVESEKSRSYGNKLAERGSLTKQEEKQQQGMVEKQGS